LEKLLNTAFHDLTSSHVRIDCILKIIQEVDLKKLDPKLIDDLSKAWEKFGQGLEIFMVKN
jgi:HD-GYP domain-containing protein (c-di-GMP phosphodiesterase class II)